MLEVYVGHVCSMVYGEVCGACMVVFVCICSICVM